MLTNKGNRIARVVGLVLLAVFVVAASAALIYQLSGGDLATIGTTIRGWFTIPAAA
jgi:hypothetical protein